MQAIKSIAVFCGSKSGINPLYEKHSEALGDLLARKNINIIYGGGNIGLMGALANAALQANGKITGIIPENLIRSEVQHNGITELLVVDSMHTRKRMLYEKCDAAIILPGGYGTLDEVFELLTWNQLNIHHKRIFFLNSDGFYDHLIAHIHRMNDEEFLYGHPADNITMLQSPHELEIHL